MDDVNSLDPQPDFVFYGGDLAQLGQAKELDLGSRIFHNASALRSTVGVSCDMCHPDAANTHPETYPKFQAQMGRVALLRDMINWCVENPVRSVPFVPDSAETGALEAYIYPQRKGTALNYGKH